MAPATAIATNPSSPHGFWPLVELVRTGHLHEAAVRLGQGGLLKTWRGRLLARWLVSGLLARSAWQEDQFNLSAALDAVDDARRIASRWTMPDVLARREGLVEQAVAHASTALAKGNTRLVIDSMNELALRELATPAAIRLLACATACQRAEEIMRAGRTGLAARLFAQLQGEYPEASWLGARVQWLNRRHEPARSGNETRSDLLNETGPVVPQSLSSGGATTVRLPLRPADAQANPTGARLLLWIDGVGHYLVCLAPELWLGRYVPLSRIQIPVLADLERRQLQFKRAPTGELTAINCQPWQFESGDAAPRAIGAGEAVRLDGAGGCELVVSDSVRIDCVCRRPESGSAVLRVVSGHRTVPAAHAIVWLGRSLLIGPQAGADIRCGGRRSSVELLVDGDELALRCESGLAVLGESASGQRRSGIAMALVAGDLTLSLEWLSDDQELPARQVELAAGG